MDYKKKYKEALANMQELYNSMKYMSSTDALHTTTALERAFPELKESEDEMIRKYLLKLADRCPEDSIDFMGEVKKEDVVAWLEKQGEQNPAWSEDDELYLEDAIHAAKELYYANCGGDELVDWLKSLKDRFQPQPQKEWSEDDEEKLNQLHKLIVKKAYEEYEIDTEDETLYGKWLKLDNWLNSLKDRVQPKWKPSDEQIEAIRIAGVVGTANDSWAMNILKDMYLQLNGL